METCWDAPAADCPSEGCWGMEYCAERCAPTVPLDRPTCGDYDLNGDGYVEETEAAAGCRSMGVPEDECHLTFHMFDLNEDLRVDCELEFPFAEDVMKFQALDLNQDGSLDVGEALFFCEAHGVDPSQCGDIFAFCNVNSDKFLSLPEVLHCEPPSDYTEVDANYAEHQYDRTAATDPEMEMNAYTGASLLVWKPPAVALRGARHLNVVRTAAPAEAVFEAKANATKAEGVHLTASEVKRQNGRKMCFVHGNGDTIPRKLWKGALPHVLATWAEALVVWKRSAKKAGRSRAASRLIKKAVSGLAALHARKLSGRRPSFAVALHAGRGARKAFEADLRRLRAALQPRAVQGMKVVRHSN